MIEDLCSGLNCATLDGLHIFLGALVAFVVVGLAWGSGGRR